MKNERGITLIALVITIIVMLILVTVTIRVATNGNLFTHAANAAKDTKTAIAGENDILNDNLDKSIEDIVAEQTGDNIITFTIDGVQFSAEKGMTWRQWLNNPTYCVNKGGLSGFGAAKGGGVDYNIGGPHATLDVDLDEPIQNNGTYTH